MYDRCVKHAIARRPTATTRRRKRNEGSGGGERLIADQPIAPDRNVRLYVGAASARIELFDSSASTPLMSFDLGTADPETVRKATRGIIAMRARFALPPPPPDAEPVIPSVAAPEPAPSPAAVPVGAVLIDPMATADDDIARMEGNWSGLQRAVFRAIRNTNQNIVINAVAGSGKTTTILKALDFIPRDKSVLLVAFNKTIQKELAARVPRDRGGLTISTLAAHGYAILRRYWRDARLLMRRGAYGNICDELRDKKVFAAALGGEYIGGDNIGLLLEQIQKLIDLCESYVALTPEAILAVAEDYDLFTMQTGGGPGAWRYQGKHRWFTAADIVTWVRRAQAERLKEPQPPNYAKDVLLNPNSGLRGGLDAYNELTENGARAFISFADMAFVPAVYGHMVPERLSDVIIVDETQDMDVAQLTVVRRSLAPGGRIIVVGDRRQAIYRFRGADSDGMDRLARELDAVSLPLSESYRVTQCAARYAQAVVPTFSVPASAPEGRCDEILAKRMTEIWGPGDIVISRQNAPLLPLAFIAIARGVTPWILGEGNTVQNRLRGIVRKILLARGGNLQLPVEEFVKALVLWHEDEVARIAEGVCQRVAEWNLNDAERRAARAGKPKPRRPPPKDLGYDRDAGRCRGPQSPYDPEKYVRDNPEMVEQHLLLGAFWNEAGTGITQRSDVRTAADVLAVLTKIAPSEKEVEDMTPEEYKAMLAERLVLTSVHRIKGGEAPRTFLLLETFRWGPRGWQKRAPDNPKDQQEEKNLWYVAATRAKYLRDPPGGGEMYFATGLQALLGKNKQYELEKEKAEASRGTA